MISRDLTVIASYFSKLMESAPQHEMNIINILSNIEEMRKRPDLSLGTSILVARTDTDECSICKKKVFCDE